MGVLCVDVMAELPRLAHDSTAGIRRDLACYAAVPFEEHLEAVTEQQRRRLEALAGRRLLVSSDLDRAAELARTRARQGIPVDALIGAYHVGDRELWRALCRRPGAAAPLLPDVASLMLESLHAISTVLALAHGEVTRELQGHHVTLSQRLVELLVHDNVGGETMRVVDALGFDPDGDFVAATWRRPGPEAVIPPDVQRGLDRWPARLVHSYHSGSVLLLAQEVDGDSLVDLASRVLLEGYVGVGLRRAGLAGAVASLGDARLALSAVGPDRRVAAFADVWGEACLLAQVDRLGPLVADATAIAVAHPHLAETVLSFAAADMSVARVAEALHLHANSVTYRLQRWGRLTGWDPRTFEGLGGSVVACRLALRGSPR